jgi:sodium transport system permease protein
MNLPDTPSPEPSTTPTWMATSGRLLRIMRKELSEVLRDRRTIMTLILMPVLLYPLLAMGFQQFLLASELEDRQQPGFRFGFFSSEEAKLVFKVVQTNLDTDSRQPSFQPTEVNPTNIFEVADMSLLLSGELDLIIRVPEIDKLPPDFDEKNRAVKVNLYHLKGSPRSMHALAAVQRQLNEANTAVLQRKLGNVLVFQHDIEVQKDNQSPAPLDDTQKPATLIQTATREIVPPKADEFPLASIIPLVLILMTITGAVYPAIDLTAGERERGTLEILVAAPVPRMGLLFAKYVSVLTIAVLTAVVNMVMMMVTIATSGIGKALFADGLSALQILQIFALLLLFAAFFSAVLLTVTSFARSFKEAQAYLIPLMLVSLAPGVAGMIPGLELTAALCLVPLLNIVLLGRDLLQNQADPLSAVIVVLSTLTYAVAAISLAAKVFGAENVLYNESSSWGDLFRRPPRPVETPSLSSALVCLGLMFCGFFVVQGILAQQIDPADMDDRFLVFQVYLMAGLSVILFAAIPLLFAQRQHVRWNTGLLLRPASVLAFLGAMLLGVSLWPLVYEMLAYLEEAGVTTIQPERRAEIASAMQRVRGLVPVAAMIAVQVIPGLVEELFFRGFLLSGLRKLFNGPLAILISAILFGLAHWVITPVLGLERLIVTILLGLVLGWVAWRSGSVLPAMVLHGCHNGLLAWLGYYQASEGADPALTADHLPGSWLLIAVAVAVVGAGLVYLGGRRE